MNGAVAQNKTHSWKRHPVSVTGGVFLFCLLFFKTLNLIHIYCKFTMFTKVHYSHNYFVYFGLC